jgi:hypothetical protein
LGSGAQASNAAGIKKAAIFRWIRVFMMFSWFFDGISGAGG